MSLAVSPSYGSERGPVALPVFKIGRLPLTAGGLGSTPRRFRQPSLACTWLRCGSASFGWQASEGCLAEARRARPPMRSRAKADRKRLLHRVRSWRAAQSAKALLPTEPFVSSPSQRRLSRVALTDTTRRVGPVLDAEPRDATERCRLVGHERQAETTRVRSMVTGLGSGSTLNVPRAGGGSDSAGCAPAGATLASMARAHMMTPSQVLPLTVMTSRRLSPP